MVLDRVISMKFLTHRVSTNSTGDFPKNSFPAIFGLHLKFLRKMQKTCLSRKLSEIEFLLAAILNLYIKRKMRFSLKLSDLE